MTCVVLKYKEDPWYLHSQKEAIHRLYGDALLVAGYPDSEHALDIVLEYKPSCTKFPFAMLESARQVIELFPTDLLFFEGDMIPHKALDLSKPSVRQYYGTAWPSVLYTGDAQISTQGVWDTWQEMNDIFEGFQRIPFERLDNGFEKIGENAEFLHPQAGGRVRSEDRTRMFRLFVEEENVSNPIYKRYSNA